MSIAIPGFVNKCITLLQSRGHSAYVVGGCVRDSLLGQTPSDWDICTSALPGQMQEIFSGIRTVPTGLKHGTLTLVGEGMSVEATTFRRDGLYLDHRRPASVDFTSSLDDDLARRDFTINAMAYNPQHGLHDPFGGRCDLAARVLRCVGDPLKRFDEDALRILRLLRFVSQLDFEPHPQTLSAAGTRSPLLAAISPERITAEIERLLVGKAAHRALGLAADSGVLGQIIPEFSPCIGFEQRTKYHDRTVDEHSFAALAFAEPKLSLRLSLLLHDIGKPRVATIDAQGQGHYKGHAGAGAKIAGQVLARLRYPSKTAAHIEKLIAFHGKQLPADPAFLRRFAGQHGAGFARELLALMECDNRAKSELCAPRLDHCRRLQDMLEQILAAGHCLTLAGLAVGGDDLIALGIPPGPQTGQLLRWLLERVWQAPGLNDREVLLGLIKDKIQQT